LDRRLGPVLIREGVRVAARDVPLIGLVDDPVGCQPTALELLRLERDDIALLDVAGDRRRDSDKAVAGRHVRGLGVHTAGEHEPEDDRLAKLLADEHGDDQDDEKRRHAGPGQRSEIH